MKMRTPLAILGILVVALIGMVHSLSGAESRVEEALTQLGLEVIDEAPAGVTPLEVRSLGELRRLLRRSGTDGGFLSDSGPLTSHRAISATAQIAHRIRIHVPRDIGETAKNRTTRCQNAS